jgi:two-component system CheB/CheR fusion protein
VPFIFDEFYQTGVSPNSSRDGYGLGLSIVQRIARLLDFQVDVKSAPGAGSVFAFDLPVTKESHAAPTTPDKRSTPRGTARREFKVLLVEDEPGVRNAMRMLLKIEGYHVITAAGAVEALEHLHTISDFNLIVTDFHLEGGRTGTQVISAARSMHGDSLKAILVTGDTSSAVREMQGDTNLRITSKPINSEELLGLMKSLLAD